MKVSGILAPRTGSFSQAIAESVTGTPHQYGHEVKDLIKSASGDGLPAMFRAAHGDAYFRTMENTIREHDVPRVKF